MTVAINGIRLDLNIDVSFQTKNQVDIQTYSGRLVGTVGYDVAKVYQDVVAIHNNMPTSVAKLEPATLTYLIIKTTDGATRPFAAEWIEESTFRRTDNTYDITITIHNVNSNEEADLINLLRNKGFEITVK